MTLFRNGILVIKRSIPVNVFLFFNLFAFHFVITSLIPRYFVPIEYRLIVQVGLNFVISITLLLSAFFIQRINKVISAYTGSAAMVILTTALLVPNEVFRLASIFGITIIYSIGLLTFFTQFWNDTIPEERGRIAGFIGFIVIPSSFVIQYIIGPSLDFFGAVVLGVIMVLGVLTVVAIKTKKINLATKKTESSIYPEKRTIFFYLVPWAVFLIVNVTLAKNLSVYLSQQLPASFYLFLVAVQFVGVVFGAVIIGFFVDFFGRRPALALSLTLYGISAALGGLLTNNQVFSFIYFVNGLSWGILFVLYTFVIWGDLSNKENCAKMYSIGLIVYFSTTGIGLITQISMPVDLSSLLTCLVVFLSIIPIVLAPELLPPDFIERTRLKSHMNILKKIKRENHG